MNSAANSQLRRRCGFDLKNKLVKTAMSEKMAQNLLPSANRRALYKRWAEGGWAVLITGGFCEELCPYIEKLALTSLSAIPINLGDNTVANLIPYQAGFQGVEVHAAHGFLLSQLMSPNSNKRDDEFGGSTDKRVELVLRIIRSIRREVPEAFYVGVKMNSADFKDEEDPQMMNTESSLQLSSTRSRSSIREEFFLRTSEEIRCRFPDLELLVTGRFRSRNGVAGALDSNAFDLIGLGRPAVKYPELPNKIMFNEDIRDDEARFDVESAPAAGWLASKVRSVGAGAETKYWVAAMKNLSYTYSSLGE
ncbi:NADH oxidase [Fusarium denticulatum]|uniref:NADH oxidase n=1 Tax=Fusarium denticulatum TaxID=48507 RepID=A0A8H5TXI2_9HYPO|nr:NADH oxidase [Fusarium denticulatum]